MQKTILPISLTLIAAGSAFAQVMSANADWSNQTTVSKSSELSTTAAIIQYNGKDQTFTVDNNMDWSANSFIFGSSNIDLGTATLNINSGSTLKLNDIYGNNSRPDTTMKIQGAGTFSYAATSLTYETNNGGTVGNVTKQISDYSGLSAGWSLSNKTVYVKDGNTVIGGNVSVAGAKFIMSGTSSFTTTSNANLMTSLTMSGNSVFTGKSLTNGGSNNFDLSGNASVTIGSSTSNSINLGNSTFAENSKITIGQTIFTADSSVITFASGVGSVNAGAWIFKSGTVNFNSTDVLASGINLQGEIRLALARPITFNINADQHFGQLDLYRTGNSDTLTINMGGAYNVEVGSFIFGNTGSKVVISNFADGLFLVKDILASNEDGSLVNVFASVGGVETKLYQLDTGYLSLTIPEPTEWAAIFGALALGLALYRRRK